MAIPIIIEPDDTVCLLTNKCNSNCVMCPMSEGSRRIGNTASKDEWRRAIEQIDYYPLHITITGGEPLLEWETVCWLMSEINRRWPQTPVLVLTNGRALSLSRVQNAIKPHVTNRYRFAVPIHASTALLHDTITQSPGSFAQTIEALQFLATTKAEIEIRIVASSINQSELTQTCKMIESLHTRVDRVNLIAMEMHGCAARNRNQLWIDYSVAYNAAEEGLLYLINKGIDVGLYNFPLCSLPSYARSLAYQSISPDKVRFADECNGCRVKPACSGLFRSTYLLKLYNVHPIEGAE